MPRPPALTLTFSSDLASCDLLRRPAWRCRGWRRRPGDRWSGRPAPAGSAMAPSPGRRRVEARPYSEAGGPEPPGRVARGEPGSLVGTSSVTAPTACLPRSESPRATCPPPVHPARRARGDLPRRAVPQGDRGWRPRAGRRRHRHRVGQLGVVGGLPGPPAPRRRARSTSSTGPPTALLALFFFVAGLELKRELVLGSLRRPADAAVPVAAAVFGVAVPALVYLLVNSGDGGRQEGWAVPAATDIAFALAVLAVVGSNLPTALRAFLLTLAVVDDLLVIAIIAVVLHRLGGPGLARSWRSSPLAAWVLLQRTRINAVGGSTVPHRRCWPGGRSTSPASTRRSPAWPWGC